MIRFLRALFIVVLASMIGVTTWASLQCPLFGIPREVYAHPWFVATLFDAYWGFTTFFVWVCYQQRSWLARVAWFVAIMLLGNLAMASYCLAQLFRTPSRRPGGGPPDPPPRWRRDARSRARPARRVGRLARVSPRLAISSTGFPSRETGLSVPASARTPAHPF
jgi:hypothetical protein